MSRQEIPPCVGRKYRMASQRASVPSLRIIRRQAGMTLAALAGAADLSVSTITAAERGGRVELGTRWKLAAALSVAPGDLMMSPDYHRRMWRERTRYERS